MMGCGTTPGYFQERTSSEFTVVQGMGQTHEEFFLCQGECSATKKTPFTYDQVNKASKEEKVSKDKLTEFVSGKPYRVYFEFAKSKLSTVARQNIHELGKALANADGNYRVTVLAGTDSFGEKPVNITLAKERAEVVKRIFIDSSFKGEIRINKNVLCCTSKRFTSDLVKAWQPYRFAVITAEKLP